MGRPANVDPRAVILAGTLRTPNGCLEWQRGVDKDGYGKVTIRGRNLRAHRVAYEAFRAPIPEGAVLDHIVCDNPRCCDPWHLEPTTHRENILRGSAPSAVNARKERCPRGHEYDYVWRGQRQCRTCQRLRHHERKEER